MQTSVQPQTQTRLNPHATRQDELGDWDPEDEECSALWESVPVTVKGFTGWCEAHRELLDSLSRRGQKVTLTSRLTELVETVGK